MAGITQNTIMEHRNHLVEHITKEQNKQTKKRRVSQSPESESPLPFVKKSEISKADSIPNDDESKKSESSEADSKQPQENSKKLYKSPTEKKVLNLDEIPLNFNGATDTSTQRMSESPDILMESEEIPEVSAPEIPSGVENQTLFNAEVADPPFVLELIHADISDIPSTSGLSSDKIDVENIKLDDNFNLEEKSHKWVIGDSHERNEFYLLKRTKKSKKKQFKDEQTNLKPANPHLVNVLPSSTTSVLGTHSLPEPTPDKISHEKTASEFAPLGTNNILVHSSSKNSEDTLSYVKPLLSLAQNLLESITLTSSTPLTEIPNQVSSTPSSAPLEIPQQLPPQIKLFGQPISSSSADVIDKKFQPESLVPSTPKSALLLIDLTSDE